MFPFFNCINTLNILINTEKVKVGLIRQCRVKGTSRYLSVRSFPELIEGENKKGDLTVAPFYQNCVEPQIDSVRPYAVGLVRCQQMAITAWIFLTTA